MTRMTLHPMNTRFRPKAFEAKLNRGLPVMKENADMESKAPAAGLLIP